MTNPFIYNPSAAIEKTAKKTSEGIGDAMDMFVKAREESFNFIKDKVDNIEKLKEDATRFNRDYVYQQVNELESLVAGALKKDSSIDLNKLGSVTDKIRSVQNAVKNGKDVPQHMADTLGIIDKNQKFMPNPALAAKQVLDAANDPKYISNPKSLLDVFKNIVMDGTDPDKVVSANLANTLNLAQQKTIERQVKQADGSIKTVAFKENPYTYFDEQSLTMKPVMVKNKAGVWVTKLNEDFDAIVPKDIQEIYSKKLGVSATLFGNTEKGIISDRVLGFLTPMTEFSIKETTSAAQAAKQQLDVKLAQLEYDFNKETNPLKKQQIYEQIKLTKANIGQTQAQTGLIVANTAQINLENAFIGKNDARMPVFGSEGGSPGGKVLEPGSKSFNASFKFLDKDYTKITFNPDGTSVVSGGRAGAKEVVLDKDKTEAVINTFTNPKAFDAARQARANAMSGTGGTVVGSYLKPKE